MANTPKNNRSFGVPDIERYHSGKMPPQEMHELEKAALEDPFLADAMEGFVHTRSASKDVADLKSRLNTRKQPQKSYGMLFRVAAMIIIMAGAGWLLYLFTFKARDISISYRDQPEMNTTKATHDTLQNKAILSDTQAVQQEDNLKAERPGAASNIKSTSQNEVRKDNESLKRKDTGPFNVEHDSLTDVNARGDIVMAAPRMFKSSIERRIQNDSGLVRNSVPVQNSRASHENIEIIDKGNRVIITIKETPEGVNEMVLSRKNKDSLVKKASSIIIEGAEPEESWNEFGQYLSDNISTLEDIESRSQTGKVRLSFDVNPSGEPVNIKIEDAICTNCEAEATRFLKEGPKWKKKTKRGKVIIQF